MDFVRASSSPAETAVIGRAVGSLLRARPSGAADVILLDGPLAAGKTTFTRAVAEGLGLDTSPVSSPTFVMVHEYGGAGHALIHVDAYRLRGEADLESLGWDRILHRIEAGEAALIVEWAERLGADFLRQYQPARIRIEHAPAPASSAAGEEQREFFFSMPAAWASRPGFSDLVARQPTTCPVTGQPVPPDSPTYPFASERARMADLYRWFSGSYQISRPLDQRDLDHE
jgi:tRNA threonylcarbamoyl adenosine modification protein YjeE